MHTRCTYSLRHRWLFNDNTLRMQFVFRLCFDSIISFIWGCVCVCVRARVLFYYFFFFMQLQRSICNTKESLRFVGQESCQIIMHKNGHWEMRIVVRKGKMLTSERQSERKQTNKYINTIWMCLCVCACVYCIYNFQSEISDFRKWYAKQKCLLCRFVVKWASFTAFCSLFRLFCCFECLQM